MSPIPTGAVATAFGDQQALSIALYHGTRAGLIRVHPLTSVWDFNHFRFELHGAWTSCCNPHFGPVELLIDQKCHA